MNKKEIKVTLNSHKFKLILKWKNFQKVLENFNFQHISETTWGYPFNFSWNQYYPLRKHNMQEKMRYSMSESRNSTRCNFQMVTGSWPPRQYHGGKLCSWATLDPNWLILEEKVLLFPWKLCSFDFSTFQQNSSKNDSQTLKNHKGPILWSKSKIFWIDM